MATAANNNNWTLEEAVRTCEELTIWMKGFHAGFMEPTPEEIPAKEQTEATAEEVSAQVPETLVEEQQNPEWMQKYNQPNPGTIDFKNMAIERLNEIMGQLADESGTEEQESMLEEIVAIADTNNLPTLAEVAERCVSRAKTVDDVINAISVALEAIATVEQRKQRLREAWFMFCKENDTTTEEMAEIISG